MPLPTPTQVDIIPFTTINHEAQKMLGISNDEYCVANAIHNLSHNPKSSIPGWCYAKKEYLSAAVNVSRASVFRYIHKLVSLGLVELHPDRKELMRTTAKWYDSTLIKKVEIVVEDMPIAKPQSQSETKVSGSINTNSLKVRQEYQDEKNQSQTEIGESQSETALYKDLQGNLDKEKDKENSNSSYEELEKPTSEIFAVFEEQREKGEIPVAVFDAEEQTQIEAPPSQEQSQSEVFVGEVVTTKQDVAVVTLKKGQNPDGSFGNPKVNEVRSYFLQAQQISSEDCSRSESGTSWYNLLRWIEKEVPGLDPVIALKKFIDCLVSGGYIDPAFVTSGKKLWWRRNELMKRIREHKARNNKLSTPPKATYGNVVGGVSW